MYILHVILHSLLHSPAGEISRLLPSWIPKLLSEGLPVQKYCDGLLLE